MEVRYMVQYTTSATAPWFDAISFDTREQANDFIDTCDKDKSYRVVPVQRQAVPHGWDKIEP